MGLNDTYRYVCVIFRADDGERKTLETWSMVPSASRDVVSQPERVPLLLNSTEAWTAGRSPRATVRAWRSIVIEMNK